MQIVAELARVQRTTECIHILTNSATAALSPNGISFEAILAVALYTESTDSLDFCHRSSANAEQHPAG